MGKSKKATKQDLKKMLTKMEGKEIPNGKPQPIGLSEPKRGMIKSANKKAKKA